jgi:hypothetical protein
MRRFLFGIFGRQIALYFGGICFLSVVVLSSLYLTSEYALKSYVTEQLQRLPWDVTAIQRTPLNSYPQLQKKYKDIDSVEQVEALGFIRIQNGGSIQVEIDGQATEIYWVGVMSASDNTLLPPELRKRGPDSAASNDNEPTRVQAALVSTSNENESYLTVSVGSVLKILDMGVEPDSGHSHDGGGGDQASEEPSEHEHEPQIKVETLFDVIVDNQPAQIERLEFNRWMLDNVGSLSYLPERSLIISVPMREFESLSGKLDTLWLPSEGMHSTESAPPYVPEISHLIRLDRSEWVTPWNLPASIKQLKPLVAFVEAEARKVASISYVGSDLQRILVTMEKISRSIWLVTLLAAIPLLWLAWIVARMLSSLLLLNQRRLIGLALIRGIPMNLISQTMMGALVIGGLVGGILGVVAGLGLPIVGYGLAGESAPPLSTLMRGLVYFPIFIGVGIMLALISGRSVINRIRRMTPREAMVRIADRGFEEDLQRLPKSFITASVLALALGGYKIMAWAAGHSLLLQWFGGVLPENYISVLLLAEAILNFIAVPLFLFGITGILRWRMIWFQYVLNALIAPFVGKLRWFVAEHMALSRTRIAGTLFLAALALSLTIMPQIAADSFYDRVVRGVKSSVGGDLQLEYNMSELTEGHNDPQPVAAYIDLFTDKLEKIEELLENDPRVDSVTRIQQYIIPSIYLPNQSGLMLNLIGDSQHYLENVYYENEFGLTRSFSQIVNDLEDESLTTSQGFLSVRQVPLDREVELGYTEEGNAILGSIKDVIAFLPGQPSIEVTQREGYVVQEIDYLNYVTKSDARVITSLESLLNGPMNQLKVVPSRVVLLVNTKGNIGTEEAHDLIGKLPLEPQSVRFQTQEIENVNKDMFISLALGNMWVFMIGGLILAVSGIFVVGLVNFVAERRTFSLLRLRGMPLSVLLRVSLSMFLLPVILGIGLGILLGAVSGFGMAQAIWDVPRVYGVAGLLDNHLIFTSTAWQIVFGFCSVLILIALAFGLWPFRLTAREAIRED